MDVEVDTPAGGEPRREEETYVKHVAMALGLQEVRLFFIFIRGQVNKLSSMTSPMSL